MRTTSLRKNPTRAITRRIDVYMTTQLRTPATKQTPATTLTLNVPPLPGAEVVAQMVRRYKPNQHQPAWGEARTFVMEAVTSTALAGNRDSGRLMSVAAPFVMWCAEEHGLELRAELIFAPTLIDRYCSTVFKSEGTGSLTVQFYWQFRLSCSPAPSQR